MSPVHASMPKFSDHATQRWQERCAGLDPESEFATARRPGSIIRRRIREGCPGHAHLLRDRQYRGFWYLVSRHRVVFVIGSNDVVITVWRLQPSKATP